MELKVLWNMFLVFPLNTTFNCYYDYLRKCFRLMGIFPCLSAVFTKGNRFCDFPFALPDNVVLKKFEPTAANYFNRSKRP